MCHSKEVYIVDVKSKANFINSVAAGRTVPCPQCGTANESTSKFCYACGFKLPVTALNVKTEEPVFKSVEEKPQQEQKIIIDTEVDEPVPVYAEGLPDWDIVPPQVVVRRHKTK